MDIALIYEEKNKLSEALKLYRRVIQDVKELNYSGSSELLELARSKISKLEGVENES